MKLSNYQTQTLKRVETGKVRARRYGPHHVIYSYEKYHFEIIRQTTIENLIKGGFVLLVPIPKGNQESYRAELTEKGKKFLEYTGK